MSLRNITIQEQVETWGHSCGPLLRSWWCRWLTWRRWCWPGCWYCSLCQSWREQSSCCSCPGFQQGFRENLESAWFWRKSWMSAHFHWEEFAIVLVWFVETIRSLVAPRMDKVPWLEKNILKYLVHLCTISPKSVNRVCCLLAWFAKIIVGKLAFVPWCWWFFLFAFFAKKNLRILVFNCI